MAARFEIAAGYLDVEADTDSALKDVKKFFKEVDDGLDDQEKAFAKSGEKSGEEYARGISDGASRKSPGVMRKLFDEIEGEAKDSSEKVGEHFTKSVTESIKKRTKTKGKGLLDDLLPGDIGGGKSFFGGLLSSAGDFFSSFAKGFSGAFSSGLDQAQTIWKSASGFFQQASNIAGGVGSVAMFAGYAALVPIVLALGGALIQFSAALFALPAAVGVAIAVIAPLMIAFKGFGEAVSAGLSGDVDKFNEALKGLAPSARTVAKEFVSLGPALKAIKKSVQGAFFQQLIGVVKPLAVQFLPMLNKGLSLVATSLGKVARGFLTLLAQPDIIKDINKLFEATARIVDRFGPSLVELFGAFFGLVETGLPWVEKFFGIMAGGIDKFVAWITKIQGNGQLSAWLQRAWEIGGQLWDVLKKTGELLATIFGDTGDEGSDFLVHLAGQIDVLNQFFKSSDGKQFLDIMVDLIQVVIAFGAVSVNAIILTGKVIDWLVDAVKTLWHWLVVAWDWIAKAVPAAGHWFADLGRTIWGAVVTAAKAVADFFVAIGHWFASAWGTVVSIGGKIIDWFAALPGLIWGWLQSLPGLVGAALASLYDKILFSIGQTAALLLKFWTIDLPGWVRAGWAWAVQYVEEGASKTWERISALPGQIWNAISSISSIIGNAFLDAWNWAWAYTVEGATRTWERLQAFPGQAWDALKSLASIIGGFFADAWQRSKDSTLNGINTVMSWLGALPGRIKNAFSDAGHWLYDAGKDLLRGLVDGVEDLLGWAVDNARHAAQRIKDGFLDIFDSHSPSQAMRKEVGRTLLPGIQVGIDDTMPDMQQYLGRAGQAIINGLNPTVNVAAPNVNVGGTTLIADLGEGIRQVVPVVVMNNPRTVAAATAVGNRQRNGWVNTGRGAGRATSGGASR